MESTETYTAEDSSESDSTEKTTHLRFLVSKQLAGSVIGKGGSRITEFQENSGARILLSRSGQYFPGTTDRIVVISGTIKEVYTAVGLVLGKLHTELQAEYGSDVELKRTRIVVPHSSTGCIIGKGGAIIKSIIEYSKADIKISPMDNTYTGLSDRLLTLSGTMEAQMRAIDLILNKLTKDDIYSQQVHSPNSYAGVVEICHREFVEGHTIGKGGLSFQQEILGRYHYGFHGCNSVNYARSPLASIQNHKEGGFNSVTIGVSDKYIGLVLGPNGSKIKQINLLTGARIKISGRGDFVSGTTDRKVTISGLQSSIDSAKLVIQYQIDSVSGEGQVLY